MEHKYEIEVGFHDDTANQATNDRYYEFLRIYDGVGIGHKQTETSTVIINSERELTKSELEKFLGGNIPILFLKKVE